MSGRTPRPNPTASPKKKRSAPPSKAAARETRITDDGGKTASDTKLYAGLGALVIALGGLVWWSLPKGHPPAAIVDDAGAESDPAPPEERAPHGDRWDRPSHATATFAIVTDRSEDVVSKLASVSEIASRLDARHCGSACDAVKKFMGDEDAFEVEVLKTEDIILPPRESMDTVAPGLSPSERDRVQSASPLAVVVRAQGAVTREQLSARTAFATAAALAEALDGFVYDEVSRRIETARDFARHTVTSKLGEPAFSPRQIVVQFYRQEDGTERLITLGMQRYGSPDLSLRGANMASGASLALVLNAAASQLAHGHDTSTLKITLEDVARVAGQKAADLHENAAMAKPIELTLTTADRVEGDPDNELAELTPTGGASREAWDAVLGDLFGGPSSVEIPLNDKELDTIAKTARRDLPGAIRRFQNGAGDLFVKGPFAIPEDARVDGGAVSELLWVAASSCDDRSCSGVLTNEPTHATNLAAGRITSVRHGDVVDWMLQSRDGKTLGGESIAVLKARRAKRAAP